MTTFLDEAQVELVVLDILGELSWPCAFGPDIAFDGERPERTSYGDMVLGSYRYYDLIRGGGVRNL